MNRYLIVLAGLLCLSLHTFAQHDIFAQAEAAYVSGDFSGSAALFETLLNQGFNQAELHYNLANARFKSGDLLAAVEHYRRAWYLAPRDPDIRANLRFALEEAGAAAPPASRMESWFHLLTLREWMQVAILAYSLLMLLLFMALFLRRIRRFLLQGGWILLLSILAASLGIWFTLQLKERPEWIVTAQKTSACFAPMADSITHFELPQAALVRQTRPPHSQWVEVEYDHRRGWVALTDIKPVYP